ncbi:MAG: dolichyl-phosphate beta-glucosyltransferase [Candidatus Kapaibacterium sp.]
MSTPTVSVIIPAFNEAERISSSLEKALDYLRTQTYRWEIIVVDDGSSDDTVRVVRHYEPDVRIVALGSNKGKGAAVRAGMLAAKGDVRVFTDADFSTPITELPKVLKELQAGADICIGSRRLDPASLKKHQPWYREAIGLMGNKIISAVLFSGIEDTQCGFKGLTAEATEALFSQMRIDGFGFDAEMLFLAKRQRLRIVQVAVDWYNDERSRLNPVRDSLKTLAEVFRIRSIHRR